MWADLACNLMLCAVGVAFAAHSPIGQRDVAKRCAWAFLASSVCYLSAWFPPAIAPHMILHVEASTWWAFCDTLAGLYIVEKSGQYWWGRLLFCTYIADVFIYSLRSFGVAFTPLSYVIDYVGYLQIITFILIGARGAGNELFNYFDLWRARLDTHQTVSQRTRISGTDA